MNWAIREGRPAPLGAHVDGDGVNFAVFSAHADRMVLCLFDEAGHERQFDLPDRDGDIWYGYVPGARAGQAYGLRAHGPYRPVDGHRFNPAKLLLDPYARRLTGHLEWNDAVFGYAPGAWHERPDPRDSAPFMPRCIVEPPLAPAPGPLRTPWAETVIYEAHVKGMTARLPQAGPAGFAALSCDAVLDHLVRLGVTAIELLPVHAFLDDRFLVKKGLVNYWGYQTVGFFAPEPRYLSTGQIAEFRTMVERFHAAGIEVLLDVVYNHTAEGDHRGPTLSFRGLDNASYYRLAADRRRYVNDTGTGNTVNTEHPAVIRLILDSLRYWAEVMGVDGFRFDLAATLGRTAHGFDPRAPLLTAMRADPVLSQRKLIAEPWDIGPGGYQLGAFPAPFAEWNDQFRDGMRRYWRGDAGMVPELAGRFTGSALQFDHSGRRPVASVNMITAHDGFTLTDVVSYAEKHNEANGEGNRDGHGDNHSDNLGVEGATDDPDILAARALRRRCLMATLLLAQGTPMILGGDELGRSQGGNNNAYCQDNAVSWLDWDAADESMLALTTRLIALRRANPVLRQTRFLHGQARADDGMANLIWWHPEGREMTDADWMDSELRALMVELRMASVGRGAVLVAFNAGGPLTFAMPGRPGQWTERLDTGRPDGAGSDAPQQGRLSLDGPAVRLFELTDQPTGDNP